MSGHSTQNLSEPERRVVIVTGASRGIGRSVASRLGAHGWSVVVNYASHSSGAQEVVESITAGGGAAIAQQADVADGEQVQRLFDHAEAAYGGVDAVVNCAGVIGAFVPAADYDLDVLDAVVRTNVRGCYVVSQQAVRRLRSGGALVNVSSSATRIAAAGSAAYTMTKGAVEALTLVLARELRGRDVTVNTVAPGPVATTELFERFLGGRPERRTELAEASPTGRLGVPEDIAEVIAFLVGPGRWVNGQVLFANGAAA